jgi:hypothetical protein
MSGTFTWQPAAGFIYAYDLVFVRWAAGAAVARRDVRFVIYPKISNRLGPQVIIDQPAIDAAPGERFRISGWALDPRATAGTGVERLSVWATRTDCTGTCDPMALGEVAYGVARADAAELFGERFQHSGFAFIADALPMGTYDLALWVAGDPSSGTQPAATVRVSVK